MILISTIHFSFKNMFIWQYRGHLTNYWMYSYACIKRMPKFCPKKSKNRGKKCVAKHCCLDNSSYTHRIDLWLVAFHRELHGVFWQKYFWWRHWWRHGNATTKPVQNHDFSYPAFKPLERVYMAWYDWC